MNSGNLIIGVLSVVVLSAPFIYNYIKTQKRKNALLSKVKEYAASLNYQLELSEVDNSIILGLDKTNKIAFWAEKQEEDIAFSHVDLEEFSSCKVIRDSSRNGEGTNLLEIRFYPKDKKKDVKNFILFDEDKGGRLCGELVLGNNWVKIYNGYLS